MLNQKQFDGKDVLRIRLRMRLNQTQFGLELGYKHPQIRISEIETGRKPVPVRVKMICQEIQKRAGTRKS